MRGHVGLLLDRGVGQLITLVSMYTSYDRFERNDQLEHLSTPSRSIVYLRPQKDVAVARSAPYRPLVYYLKHRRPSTGHFSVRSASLKGMECVSLVTGGVLSSRDSIHSHQSMPELIPSRTSHSLWPATSYTFPSRSPNSNS